MVSTVFVMLLCTVLSAAVLLTGLLYYQGKRAPTGNPQYVALGSSFAAGIGLGERAPSSPLVCMRTINSYPQQLARLLELSLVDMTCSGAKTKHVLGGGQVFLGPQLGGLSKDTELVTLTIGGNDIGYVGDLTKMASKRSQSFFGWIMRLLASTPLPTKQRPFDNLKSDMLAVLHKIHQTSPRARIVVVTYPAILPASGTCVKLSISEAETDMMRLVGDQLAEVTRAVAKEGDAILVDMHSLGVDHHACSAEPWINGWIETNGTTFHPTLAGATATAQAIAAALK